MNITACLVHKELSSTIGDTLLLENDLPLETLKVVDAFVMVDAVDEVYVVRVVVVVEEVICFNPSLRNSLVKTVDWLITADPKKKSAKNQTTANIGYFEVYTGNEYDRLYGAQRAELHNRRHYSDGKRSATRDPEGGGWGGYGGSGVRGGRGRGSDGHGRGRGRGRCNFEIQVAAIIAKTSENEANKITNALDTVVEDASAING